MRLWFLTLVALLLLAVSGCGPTPPPSKSAAFIADQRDTITPDGPIDLSSVEETPEGVRYRTANGRSWEVQMASKPGGGYAYGVLRPAEAERRDAESL